MALSLAILGVLFLNVRGTYQLQPVLHSDADVPLDEIYDLAKTSYFQEDYEKSVKLFERSLITYKMLQHLEIACNAKCANSSVYDDFPTKSFNNFPDLLALGSLVVQANCLKLCREEHPYGVASQDTFLTKEMLNDFEAKKPYDYLQFAYFQIGRVQQASQAVFTYFQANPHHAEAIENMAYYKSLDEIKEEDMVDLEAAKFDSYYVNGINAYFKKKYQETIKDLEMALVEYYKAFTECEALCYKPYDFIFFDRFYKSLALQYADVLKCSVGCIDRLNPVLNGQVVDNFVAQCFAYLQFSYFQLGNVGMAAPAAASALLLNPEDKDARSNMEFYKSSAAKHGLSVTIHLSPRADAQKFFNHVSLLNKTLDRVFKAFDYDDEGEAEYAIEENADAGNNEEDFMTTLDKQIMEKIEERLSFKT